MGFHSDSAPNEEIFGLTFIWIVKKEFYSLTSYNILSLTVLQPEKVLQKRWPKRPVMNDKEGMLRYIIMKITTNTAV